MDESGNFLDPDKIFLEILEELAGRKDAGVAYDFSTQTCSYTHRQGPHTWFIDEEGPGTGGNLLVSTHSF